MSTTTDAKPMTDFDAIAQTIADLGGKAYDGIFDAHAADLYGPGHRCMCGRSFRTPNGLGLHLGAIRRQADQAMAGEMDRVRMVLRLPGSWLHIAGEGTPTMVTSIHSIEGSKIITGVNAYTTRTLAEWLALGWTVRECGGRP